jgi:hypothetical protein
MEQSTFEQNSGISAKMPLPNAAATLVLGILSLVFSWCCWTFGVVGITLGIVALAISTKSIKQFKANPGMYDGFGNLKAGRIMAIIGLCISSLWALILIIWISIVGIAAFSISEIINSFRF